MTHQWHVAITDGQIVAVGQSADHCRRVATVIGVKPDEIRPATTPVVKGAVRGRHTSNDFRIRADGSVADTNRRKAGGGHEGN